MHFNPYVTVHINLDRIRANVEQIRALVNVPILAVVKADAYGLGAAKIVEAAPKPLLYGEELVLGFHARDRPDPARSA